MLIHITIHSGMHSFSFNHQSTNPLPPLPHPTSLSLSLSLTPTLNASSGGHTPTTSLFTNLIKPRCPIIQPLFNPDFAFLSVKGWRNL